MLIEQFFAARSMWFVFSQVEVVKIKYPYGVLVAKRIARGQLLIKVHVAGVQLGVFVHLIHQAGEKAVLVEMVVHDVISKIHHQFVVEQKLQTAGFKTFWGQGQKQSEIVPNAPVEVIALIQFVVVQYFASEAFFQSNPLHQSGFLPPHEPLHLLPGTMFGLCDVFVPFAGENMHISVGGGEPHVVAEVVGRPDTHNEL